MHIGLKFSKWPSYRGASAPYPFGCATGLDVHLIVGCITVNDYQEGVGVKPLRDWQTFVKLVLWPKTLQHQPGTKFKKTVLRNYCVKFTWPAFLSVGTANWRNHALQPPTTLVNSLRKFNPKYTNVLNVFWTSSVSKRRLTRAKQVTSYK